MRDRLIFFVTMLLAAAPACTADTLDVSPLRNLPVLDHGRIKPIDTVARETVRFVTGSEYFGTVTTDSTGLQEVAGSVDPLALILDWGAHPLAWQTQPVIHVSLLTLRAKLGMKESQQWISARQIMENTAFTAWVQGVEQTRAQAEQNKESIIYSSSAEKSLDDAAVDLDQQLKLFESATDLSLYFLVPSDGPKSDQWIPLSAILSLTGQQGDMAAPIKTAWTHLLDAYNQNDSAQFAAASTQLKDSITQLVGGDYSDSGRIDREVFYNSFKPFRWAWIIYFAAIAALVAALMSRRVLIYAGAMALFALAIGFHASAFALRCSITGWAPVTNMYETVIWVAMMGAVFAYILELVYRQRTIAIAGATVALLATVVADFMPAEYGSSFHNLTPVLRSNYWLAIHVLTIVSSYAAFALALVLGNIVLGQYIHGHVDPAIIRTNIFFTYRAVQIGVLLVAAGTILGGLWADVSWGRFWGWDPKEVWALIVLLTYLALLHGRFAGWIKQFGTAAGAVLCFTAVVMSWYGVNFVLGVGLHSYGFGAGGQAYVFSFVGLQWAYVLVAWLIHRARLNAQEAPAPKEEPLPRGLPLTGK